MNVGEQNDTSNDDTSNDGFKMKKTKTFFTRRDNSKELVLGKYENSQKSLQGNELTIPSRFTQISRQNPNICNYKIKNIIIPKTIEIIKQDAFRNCNQLESITINSTKEENTGVIIGDTAFFNCSNLKKVIINGNVKSIGMYAFGNCKNLSNVEIYGNVEKIKMHAFQECNNKFVMKIIGNVGTIEMNAFDIKGGSIPSSELPEPGLKSSLTINGNVDKINQYGIPNIKTIIIIGELKSYNKINSFHKMANVYLNEVIIQQGKNKIKRLGIWFYK